MPSDPSKPSSSSSSAAKPSSSSSAAKPSSSSSSAKPPSSSSSGSSSSSSSKPSAPESKPPQATPYITANAWMSFFLFVCLVLIILQGPLGLSAAASSLPIPMGMEMGMGLGGMMNYAHASPAPVPAPCAPAYGYQTPQAHPWWQCGTYVQFPWCPPAATPCALPQYITREIIETDEPSYDREPRGYAYPGHQMGGQGHVATPGGGAGFSWYSNPDGPADRDRDGDRYRDRQIRDSRPYRSVQYQRRGVQVQIETGDRPAPRPRRRARVYQTQDIPIMPPPQAVPVLPLPTATPTAIGLANLENAFYPLLIGAIALLVIFDYAS